MKEKAHDIFQDLLEKKPSIYEQVWKGRPFEKIKYIATTEKGDLGEDFLERMLRHLGYSEVHTKKGRRGQYDVSIKSGKRSMFFEVKVASQDTNDNFQFNGIRYDTNYSHLFCLGITPDTLAYLIIKKGQIGSGNYKMVTMAKGSNATFKLTRTLEQLKSFDAFDADIKNFLEESDSIN